MHPCTFDWSHQPPPYQLSPALYKPRPTHTLCSSLQSFPIHAPSFSIFIIRLATSVKSKINSSSSFTMEAFLYQQHQSFILDSVYDSNYLLNSPINDITLNAPPHNGDFSNVSSCFQDSPTSSLDAAPQASLEKKRKQSAESCLSTRQPEGAKESKSRKKNQNGGSKKAKAKELKDKKETIEEPPSGYIHVRARRGQATDSHSLAERVRRERIGERMKKLQGLVPGCDKVIGKALVLDEIINYVQSLQNQVEFLSMKIASLNPVLYDFGVGFQDYMSQPEEMGSISQSMPCPILNSHIPPTSFEGATSSPVMYGQGPHNFSQDAGSFLMLNNMCSFQ